MKFAMVLGACVVLLGCGDDDGEIVCTPGAALGCTCSDGRTGIQFCEASGEFGVCACDPVVDSGRDTAVPFDAGVDSGRRDTAVPGCDVVVADDELVDSCGPSDLCDCTIDVDACLTEGCSICLSRGRCEPALPRRVRIAVTRAIVPTFAPDGMPWDVGGGAPDLYVSITVDGVELLAKSAVAMDAFDATFTGTFVDANVVNGSQIVIVVLDEDVTSDDGAFECSWSTTPALLRGRALDCGGTLGSVFGVVFGI